MSGFRCQVSGGRDLGSEVSGQREEKRCQVSGVRCQRKAEKGKRAASRISQIAPPQEL
jgi:hypothetical protein